MNKTKIITIVTSALFSVVVLAVLESPAGQHSDMDKAIGLYELQKYEESNLVLIKISEETTDNEDVYWMIARNYFYMGDSIPIEKNKDKKLEMYILCEKWARKGYEKDPDLADNPFFVAVGMAKQAETNGIISSIISDRTGPSKIEDFFQKSLAAKDFHEKTERTDTRAGAHMALCIFYRKIPDSSIVKIITGTKGDADKSVDHCRKALARFPKDIQSQKELGASLLCRGQRNDNDKDMQEGKSYLETLLKQKHEIELELIDQEDSRKLLLDPSLACGYSRVQQEDVDVNDF
jgi:hypothetical protein